MNLFYTIMTLIGCVQMYYKNSQYGDWDFNPALDYIFRNLRNHCDKLIFTLE